MKIPKSIRDTAMLDGKELKYTTWASQFGTVSKSYILPEGEKSFNRVRNVLVLKEDEEHNPVWWMERGVNWIHFGALTKLDAIELFEELTGTRLEAECTFDCIMYVEESGVCSFRLHI